MAVIELDKPDIEKLTGRKLTKQDIEERIPMFGCPLEKTDGNKLYYEIFPNRPDMLSAEGFARAIGMFLGYRKQTSYRAKPPKIKMNVENSVKSVRPHVVAAVVRNVRFTDASVASIMQVQEKLHDTLGRKRKKVAIGVHDLEKVHQPFVYKAVDPDSVKFIPLGMDRELTMSEICRQHPKGIEYAHILKDSRLWPIILDKNGNVLSFPPIINGELTKVVPGTKNLFIEITGTSELAVNQALNIIITSLADRGFVVEAVNVAGKVTPNLRPRSIRVDIDYVNRLLEMNLDYTGLSKILKKMDMSVSGKYVSIPPYRADIMHQMDIVEDVAIVHGYQKFEPRIPKTPTIARRLGSGEFSYYLKNIMTGMGFQEVISSFLSHENTEFEKMLMPDKDACRLLNSVSSDFSICRTSIIPSLLKILCENQHREYPQNIFELGDVAVADSSAETGAKISKRLSSTMCNSRISYEEISSVLSATLNELGLKFELKKAEHPSLIPGRTAEILVNGKPHGFVGEVHPQVLNNFSIGKPVAVFELEISDFYRL
jgi:phenylalanyl-tRNA synthetase beta chain